MIRRPPRSTLSSSSAASDVYKRQALKKVYFPEYRFSEDLDFVIDSKKEINVYKEVIIQILQKISSDYPIKTDTRSMFERDRLQLFITYDIIPDIKGIK